VRPVLARRVPTGRMLLSAFFQERVNYFAVYMLLLYNTAVIKEYMYNFYVYIYSQ
jgi:hypothetical protein